MTAELSDWVNQIHQGDCLELMGRIPSESVDLVFTSPPYNLRNTTSGGARDWGKDGLLADGYDTHDDAMPHDEYVEWQRACLGAMMRLLTPQGALFYNQTWRSQGGLLQDRKEIVEGFPVRQIIIWHRGGSVNHNPHYFMPTYEVIYLIAKPQFKLAPKGNGIGSVWRIPAEDGSNSHPAPFPVELPRRAIAATAARVVLDPFVGSGSTAMAAAIEGRDYIGIDSSRQYCRMARERVASVRAARLFA